MIDKLDEIKDLIIEVKRLQDSELKNIRVEIYNIIKNNITDERVIESVFDRLLDLSFTYGDDLYSLYSMFVNYYSGINKEASLDYKAYYLKIIKE